MKTSLSGCKISMILWSFYKQAWIRGFSLKREKNNSYQNGIIVWFASKHLLDLLKLCVMVGLLAFLIQLLFVLLFLYLPKLE